MNKYFSDPMTPDEALLFHANYWREYAGSLRADVDARVSRGRGGVLGCSLDDARRYAETYEAMADRIEGLVEGRAIPSGGADCAIGKEIQRWKNLAKWAAADFDAKRFSKMAERAEQLLDA